MSVLALILSLIGNILMAIKCVKLAYWIWIISNFIWMYVGFKLDEVNYPQELMYAIYSLINLWAIKNWGKEKNDRRTNRKNNMAK